MKKIVTYKNFLLFSLFALFAASLLFIPSANASWVPIPNWGSSSTGLERYGEALREPSLNLEQFNLFNLDYTTWGLTQLLIGIPTGPESGDGEGASNGGGAAGILSSWVASLYLYRPVSGVEYFAYLGENFGIIKPAYAQGTGFAKLGPVIPLWTMSRNIAYLGFVIIFVMIGFMIMLRARIDPRTVATVQAAIPGIVIALILVTLSFALAGLVIDLTQVLIRLLASDAMLGRWIVDANTLVTNIEMNKDYNLAKLLFSLVGPGRDPLQSVLAVLVSSFSEVGGLIEFAIESPIGGGLIGVIVGLAVVFAIFKIFFMLLMAFITIILLTIAAPFQFLFAAIPGQGKQIFNWLRSIGSAALVFPVTFFMLMLAAIFLGGSNLIDVPGEPISGLQWTMAPLGVFDDLSFIPKLIGLGLLLMTPKAADIVREAFQQARAPEWAGEPGRALGGIARRFIPF